MHKSALAILLFTISLGACSSVREGNVDAITEERIVPAFSSIALNGIGTVRIHQGPQAVRVTLGKNVIDRYETYVKGKALQIGYKCSPTLAFRKLENCEVDIAVPEFDGIELNGTGRIFIDEFFYDELTIRMTGAGSIELRGSVPGLIVSCTGAGKIHARDLVSKDARVSLTGGCRVEVRAEEKLDASVTGSGQLVYWGNPNVTQRISGAGGILRAGD